MKLREAVIERLSGSPGEKLKARELAHWLVQTYPAACQTKLDQSKALHTENDLLGQLVAEIGSNRPGWQAKHPQLKTTAGKPRLYYWSEESEEEIAAAADEGASSISSGAPQFSEADLYPKIVEFLRDEFGVFSKRIDEKTASNRKGSGANKWLFPDICGLQDLVSGLHRDVRALLHLANDKKALLWSVEVKVVLNLSNVREAFFQTVSNSSWANFGYLVAAQVDQGALAELRMLHGLHGIGVIQLNTTDPSESQVLIPATLRPTIDWQTFNRLTVECGDFRTYGKLVRHFHQTEEANPISWGMPDILS